MINTDRTANEAVPNGQTSKPQPTVALLPGETIEEAMERIPELWASIRCD